VRGSDVVGKSKAKTSEAPDFLVHNKFLIEQELNVSTSLLGTQLDPDPSYRCFAW
jgi:hypothetical protein